MITKYTTYIKENLDNETTRIMISIDSHYFNKSSTPIKIIFSGSMVLV